MAEPDFDAIETILDGFFGELRNEVAVDGIDHSSTWRIALRFVIDILTRAGESAGARAAAIEKRLSRMDSLFGRFIPNPVRPPSPIRALSPAVVDDLYAIFDPRSNRNPFKTEALRWRNLLIFMLLLRLGLRRGEAALLVANSIKDDLDPSTGKTVVWMDVDTTADDDPRYIPPGLKTARSKRQLPVPEEILLLSGKYLQNYRGKHYSPFLLMSQKGTPLSLRAISEVFEIASRALSERARKSLEQQGLLTVSCHDLRHTCAVVRLKLYQDAGNDLDLAMDKLRVFFGWSPQSEMPRLYARAYFETKLSEVWNENFDAFVDALRLSVDRSAP
jgi:integrase